MSLEEGIGHATHAVELDAAGEYGEAVDEYIAAIESLLRASQGVSLSL